MSKGYFRPIVNRGDGKPKRHTSGPYFAEGPDDFGDWNIIPVGQSAVVAAVISNMRDAAEVSSTAKLLAAAPEMLEALKVAGQFIKNGIELGFIRMPSPGTPDRAHDALPMIIAAVAKAEGYGP